jgi:hypothetical protein
MFVVIVIDNNECRCSVAKTTYLKPKEKTYPIFIRYKARALMRCYFLLKSHLGCCFVSSMNLDCSLQMVFSTSVPHILMGTETDPTCCHRRRMYNKMTQASSSSISSTVLNFIVGGMGLYQTLAARVSLNHKTRNFLSLLILTSK